MAMEEVLVAAVAAMEVVVAMAMEVVVVGR